MGRVSMPSTLPYTLETVKIPHLVPPLLEDPSHGSDQHSTQIHLPGHGGEIPDAKQAERTYNNEGLKDHGTRDEFLEDGRQLEVLAPTHLTSLYNFDYTSPLLENNYIIDLDWEDLHRSPIWPQVKPCRLLIHPKVSELRILPRGRQELEERWITVNCPSYDNPARVLAVASGPEQIGCTIIRYDEQGTFTFNAEKDTIFFENDSDRPIEIMDLGTETGISIAPRDSVFIHPGVWGLAVDTELLMEFEVLGRMEWPIDTERTRKRIASAKGGASQENPSKKRKVSNTRGGVPPRVDVKQAQNDILRLQDGENIYLQGIKISRIETIYENKKTLVWRGKYVPDSGPEECVGKTLKSSGLSPVQVARLWKREYDALRALQGHENIVKLLGADVRFHSLFLEHTDAKALSWQIGPTDSFTGSREDVRNILLGIASALSWVHEKGLVHGDVKPANILYTPERGAVLIDFGSSFRPGDPIQTSGTPWYLPPEFMMGSELRGPESDVWALGCTTLWLLGYIHLPEKSWQKWEIADIHLAEKPEGSYNEAQNDMTRWLKYLKMARRKLRESDELERIVSQALEIDRKKRINAALICEELNCLSLAEG